MDEQDRAAFLTRANDAFDQVVTATGSALNRDEGMRRVLAVMGATSAERRERRFRAPKTDRGLERQRLREILDALSEPTKRLRKALFGSEEPPFQTWQGATTWIESQRAAASDIRQADVAEELFLRAVNKSADELFQASPFVEPRLVLGGQGRIGLVVEAETGRQFVRMRYDSGLGILVLSCRRWAEVSALTESDLHRLVLTGTSPKELPTIRISEHRAGPSLPSDPVLVRETVTVELDVRDVTHRTFMEAWMRVRSVVGLGKRKKAPRDARAEELRRTVECFGGPRAPDIWRRVRARPSVQEQDTGCRAEGVPTAATPGEEIVTTAAIYARRSTEQRGSDAEAKSIALQIQNARTFAAERGWLIDEDHVYWDDAVSGADPAKLRSRQRLIDVITAGAPFQILIVREPSRFSRRDGDEAFGELKQIARAGVEVWFYKDRCQFAFGTFGDNVVGFVRAEAAADYRRQISGWTKDALTAKAKAGHVVGGTVFGYNNIRVDGHVERKINEAEAAIVREIFERTAAGQGLKTIAKALNATQAPSPRMQAGRYRGWSPSSVRSVVHRPLYTGLSVWNRTKKRDAAGQQRQHARPQSEWLTQRPSTCD